ncbi:MAG: DUF1858 domain-containing protein [Clostridia bacterium]|nr:DUF1858 domain-containing protein [Clostridia bacterium]MBQ8973645.1 DUF1858 domain-containing protein [Clostridia bacterium]
MTVEKTMSIAEVLELDRQTAPIMMSYGMHCMGCPMAMMESLEMACAGHGADADALVKELNDYFAQKAAK